MARRMRKIEGAAAEALAAVEAARDVAEAAEKVAASAWADLRARAVEAAAAGAPKTRVASATGVSASTVWRWLEEDADVK